MPSLRMEGAWFGALIALLAFDLLVSLVDFALERGSRAQLGGLPAGEYLLHVLMGIVFGALVAAILLEDPGALSRPTGLAVDARGVPDALRWTLAGMAPLVLATGILDAIAVVRLGRRRTGA